MSTLRINPPFLLIPYPLSLQFGFRQQNNMNASNYEVIRQIGGGQQGKIFLAQRDRRLYALKELISSPSEGEIQLLSNIKHPAIIGFHQALLKDSVVLVLEYASEGDLAGFIRRNYPQEHVPETVVRSWLLQMCLALHHLHHDLNIIHRDIKLINVLVTAEGQLKLSDFGLAKKVKGEDDFTKSTVGTPYYLSPETLSSSRCSTKSDMWALGCLLYQICTGEKPFKGAAFGEIIKNILEKPHGELPQCYSKWLSDLVQALLEKSAEKRPGVQLILEQEEMQREFSILKAMHKDYQKLSYPTFSLKTAKNLERECLSSNLKHFSQSLKTTRKDKSFRLPPQEPPCMSQQKKVERTRFAHKSLRMLLQKKGDKK